MARQLKGSVRRPWSLARSGCGREGVAGVFGATRRGRCHVRDRTEQAWTIGSARSVYKHTPPWVQRRGLEQDDGARTNLARASYSKAAVDGASKDMRYRLRSAVVPSAESARLPVLRFLGNDSGATSFPRPLSSSPVLLSAPGNVSASVLGRAEEGRDERWSFCPPCI